MGWPSDPVGDRRAGAGSGEGGRPAVVRGVPCSVERARAREQWNKDHSAWHNC